MNVNKHVIEVQNLGKLYKLYPSQISKFVDLFGINKFLFWRKQSYKNFWALRNISFSIQKGERVGIIGHNGAGKSTLLKTLIGVHEPSEGKFSVQGKIQALMQLGTGFHPDFTGRENIQASLEYNNLTQAEIESCTQEIIDFIELDEFIDQPVKNYSAGMYARLAFATATAIKPEVLIIDEVLGAGDAYFAGKCVERMKRLSHDSGATVLFVSHDLASVQNMCERCLWIDRGLLRMDGPTLDVVKAYSAQVRQREELRLQIRNEKKLNTQKSLDIDYTKQKLFRLRAKENAPISCIIKKISFEYLGNFYAEVFPGTPLDTDSSQTAFIISNEVSNGWSESQKDENNLMFRKILLDDSHIAIFGLLMQEDWNINDLKITIEYSNQTEGTVVLEHYNNQEQYELLKKINLKNSKQELICILEKENILKSTPLSPTNDVYGSCECIILDVRFIVDNKKSFLLPKESNVYIEIEYESFQFLPNPIFVFAIYTHSGQNAMQIYHDFKDVNQVEMIPGKGVFRFCIDHLSLGTGKYIASAAIFKHYPLANEEPEAYYLIDRKIEFEVFSNQKERMSTGICIQKTIPNLILK